MVIPGTDKMRGIGAPPVATMRPLTPARQLSWRPTARFTAVLLAVVSPIVTFVLWQGRPVEAGSGPESKSTFKSIDTSWLSSPRVGVALIVDAGWSRDDDIPRIMSVSMETIEENLKSLGFQPIEVFSQYEGHLANAEIRESLMREVKAAGARGLAGVFVFRIRPSFEGFLIDNKYWSETRTLQSSCVVELYSPAGKRYGGKYGASAQRGHATGPVSGPFVNPVTGSTYYTAKVDEDDTPAETLAAKSVRKIIEMVLKPYSAKP